MTLVAKGLIPRKLNYATSFYKAWESRRKQRHMPFGVRGLKPPDFFEMLKMTANKLFGT